MVLSHTSTFITQYPSLRPGYIYPFPSLPHLPKTAHREVQGQECNFYHFISHSGFNESCGWSQPNLSTWESSPHSCFALVLSLAPPNLSHMFPGIGVIQRDISSAILITARAEGNKTVPLMSGCGMLTDSYSTPLNCKLFSSLILLKKHFPFADSLILIFRGRSAVVVICTEAFLCVLCFVLCFR